MSRKTLQSLAQALGVSRTTVSNAYSHPEKLSAQLRERILTAARELGYDGPSPLAASLRTGRTDSLGVLFTDDLGYAFTDPVSSLFLAGVAEQAQRVGYALTVVSAPRAGGTGAMSRAMVDGLIVYSVDEDSEGLAVARKRRIPTVMVDQAPQAGETSVIISDREGARAGLAHLAELGHVTIAAVTVAAGPAECALVAPDATSHNYVARERLTGWRNACTAADLAPPATISCPFNGSEHGRHAARLLLDLDPAPTAVVCLSDELARGVMAELADHDVRVPRDVSVVGFDDSPNAALAHPPLTTVRQPARDKGALAASLLIERLRTGQVGPGQVLPTELVVRASTAEPQGTPGKGGRRAGHARR
jgi:DNA-binding LacI/PurR family transcriptional regulator